MGIFGVIGKVISGKPVFEPKQGEQGPFKQPDPFREHVSNTTPSETTVRAAEHKVSPTVRIGRIENHVSGSRLEVYADLKNESHEPVFLDFINIFEVRRELDTQLAPGQSCQFLVYVGPLLHELPHGYAEVQYRTATEGDYFSDRHEVRVRPEGINGYYVTECLLRGPVEER